MHRPTERLPRALSIEELGRVDGGSDSRNIEFEMIENEIQKLAMIDHLKDQQEKIEPK